MNFLNKLPHDKALHVIVGVLFYAAFHFFGPVVGMAAATAAAVGKEIYDYFHKETHTPDVWDAVATIGGGVLGLICGA
jgi:TRAP-type C4-dicarboxylate transport system permease large subunit